MQVAARLAQAATHNFDSASMCNALGVAKEARGWAATEEKGGGVWWSLWCDACSNCVASNRICLPIKLLPKAQIESSAELRVHIL